MKEHGVIAIIKKHVLTAIGYMYDSFSSSCWIVYGFRTVY